MLTKSAQVEAAFIKQAGLVGLGWNAAKWGLKGLGSMAKPIGKLGLGATRGVSKALVGRKATERVLGDYGLLGMPMRRLINQDIVRPYASVVNNISQVRRTGLQKQLAKLQPGSYEHARLSDKLTRLNKVDDYAAKQWVRSDQEVRKLDDLAKHYKTTRKSRLNPERIASGRFLGPMAAWMALDPAFSALGPAGKPLYYASAGPVMGPALFAAQSRLPAAAPERTKIPRQTQYIT